jgi:hypothetical protein
LEKRHFSYSNMIDWCQSNKALAPFLFGEVAMDKRVRFGLVLYPDEKHALEQLAEAHGGLSLAATLRRLIRLEAHRLALWPSCGSAEKQGLGADYE